MKHRAPGGGCSRRLVVMSMLGVAAAAFFPAAARAANAGQPAIVVFAASSLTDVLGLVSADFEKATGIHVKLSFASSAALARQIESGAPADVFISADSEWMDYLQARNLIAVGTRRDLLGNRLVLVARATSTIHLKIQRGFHLAEALGSGRLATGDTESVPVGRYARAALSKLGVWDSVAARIAGAENVRAALVLVDRGEAPLGIVYETDALIDKAVRIVDTFPADSHPPIVYPVALTASARAGAAQFEDYLRTPAADASFLKFGFMPMH